MHPATIQILENRKVGQVDKDMLGTLANNDLQGIIQQAAGGAPDPTYLEEPNPQSLGASKEAAFAAGSTNRAWNQ